jgi:hypothetical protein
MTDSEFMQAYAIAAKIAAPYAGKSLEKQLEGVTRALYEWMSGMRYSDTAPHYNTVYGFYVNKVSSCAGATRALGLCLNILGIAYEHVNENQWSHQWCRVRVGRVNWICDVFQPRYGPESNPVWAVRTPSGTVWQTIPNARF